MSQYKFYLENLEQSVKGMTLAGGGKKVLLLHTGMHQGECLVLVCVQEISHWSQ